MFIVYGGYLWFQLYSHTSLYNDEGGDVAKSTIYSPRTHNFLHRKNKDVEAPASTSMLTGVITRAEGKEAESKEAEGKEAEGKETESKETPEETPEDELETPQMTVWVTLGLLAVVTVVSYLIYTLILSH